MTRLMTLCCTIALALVGSDASAQGRHGIVAGHGRSGAASFYRGVHTHHGSWQRQRSLDLVRLDAYADELATIASHLHGDAHQLSQDYHHSALIQHYVDQVAQLQHHLHAVLHEATVSGRQSIHLAEHIRCDLRESKMLFHRLYTQLRHQEYDGARRCDQRLMAHMQEIILCDAFPLIRRMEDCLNGHRHASVRVPVPSAPTPRPYSGGGVISLGRLQIRF